MVVGHVVCVVCVHPASACVMIRTLTRVLTLALTLPYPAKFRTVSPNITP